MSGISPRRRLKSTGSDRIGSDRRAPGRKCHDGGGRAYVRWTRTATATLGLLTTLLLVGGGALLVGELALLARYLRTRRPALVVEHFDDDDPVRLSAPRGDGERAARALSAALD